MKGKYYITVQNKKLRYELEVKRNITIIRGDSATGKTTLIEMLESAANLGESSGIEVICERPCRVLRGNDWELLLSNLHEQILFLDEECLFVKSREFAAAVRKSDNYFVIITREDLPNLPYAVDEIYGIHTSGKYHDLKRTYNEMYRIYSTEELKNSITPEEIIVEDSNSGFDFFKKICCNNGIQCISAKGKSNLKNTAKQSDFKNVLIVADGAAIGSEMNELYQLMKSRPNIKCYLPESFEWIILRSGMIDGNYVQEVLNSPEDYIESSKYFSWERYFTALLITCTKDSYLTYSKSGLNDNYLHGKIKDAILDVMKSIKL